MQSEPPRPKNPRFVTKGLIPALVSAGKYRLSGSVNPWNEAVEDDGKIRVEARSFTKDGVQAWQVADHLPGSGA